MPALVVVSDPRDWQLDVPDVRVVSAHEYLTDARFAEEPRLKVVNLCRSLGYQRSGYYVSLLAEARGHKPLPSIGTVQDLKSQSLILQASDELDALIQRDLAPIQSDRFELSVYFGRNVAKSHDGLAAALSRMFHAPLMRAHFKRREKTGRWVMNRIDALDAAAIPEPHRDFVLEVARDYFGGRYVPPRRKVTRPRFDLAILRDPSDPEPASDDRAVRKFVKAGESVGFAVEVIGRDDFARVPEFDALFIRDTTSINHYTYRFARRARASGLVVLDEPDSILKCTNKVYLAEVLAKAKVPTTRTVIVHRRKVAAIERELGLPCVLKQPDGAFSAGVIKVDTREELERELDRLFEKSSLVIAQEFKPTPFDWRIGVLDGQPLYACRYYMARAHWQIIKRDEARGTKLEGKWDTLPVEQAPTQVVRAALKAASLYGDGLFGVDVKADDAGVYVIEVNENPSIDAGVEDAVLKDELYLRVMRFLMARVEQRSRAGAPRD
ncbi:MAG: RimK family protein [Kofleriaceae bacterium]|nr:RimK family protein [Myxococcales bacterium]MCB9565491.1 RimK family protein [Kofleriaceae bacterium]MCB9570967.1 RimK family protein [Kofleriaceae bacterium]